MENDYLRLAAMVNNIFDTVEEINPLAEGLNFQQSLQPAKGFGKVLPRKVRRLKHQRSRSPRSHGGGKQDGNGTRQNGGGRLCLT
jgi:hypothetical protein